MDRYYLLWLLLLVLASYMHLFFCSDLEARRDVRKEEVNLKRFKCFDIIVLCYKKFFFLLLHSLNNIWLQWERTLKKKNKSLISLVLGWSICSRTWSNFHGDLCKDCSKCRRGEIIDKLLVTAKSCDCVFFFLALRMFKCTYVSGCVVRVTCQLSIVAYLCILFSGRSLGLGKGWHFLLWFQQTACKKNLIFLLLLSVIFAIPSPSTS